MQNMIILFTKRSAYLHMIQSRLPGIGWPEDFEAYREELSSRGHLPTNYMIKPHYIASGFTMHAATLLSFGLCCPYLALAVILSIALSSIQWRMLLGRFLVGRHGVCVAEVDPAIVELNSQLSGSHLLFSRAVWSVAMTSCFFITCLCWDVAGDKQGFRGSTWVPAFTVLFLGVMWVGNNFPVFRDWYNTLLARKNSTEMSVGSESGISLSVDVNPISGTNKI